MADTNNTNTNTVNSEPAASTALIEAEGQAQEPSCPHRRWGLILLLLLFALLFAGAYGAYYLQAEIGQVQSALNTDLQSIRDSQGQFVQQLQAQQDARQSWEQQLSRIREQQVATDSRLQRLVRTPHKDSRDWVLAEAEYLIRAADTRVRLERDVVSAALAMEQADQRLMELGLPDLIPVRKQLRQDINNLRAVAGVDIPGKALLLSDLAERVVSLSMKEGMGRPSLKAEQPVASASEQPRDWRGMLAAVWHDIKTLIVIRKQETPDAVLYDPDRNEHLYQNIQQELLSARLSMLRRDSKNMQASLKRVSAWLRDYFDTRDPAVKSVASSLEELQGLELSPPLPSVSGSLRLLQDYLRQRAEADAS